MAYKSGFGLNKFRGDPNANTQPSSGASGTVRTPDLDQRITSEDYTEAFRFNLGGAVIKSIPKANESFAAHNVLDAYGQTFPVRVFKGIVADDTNAFNYHHSNVSRVKSTNVVCAQMPAYTNSSWLYGAAVRIYSDGTGAGVFFLDSDANGETFSRYLQSGGTTQWVQYDSDWNKWGGLLASTTASAPDSDLRNTAADSDWYYENESILTNIGDRGKNSAEYYTNGSFQGNKAILYEAIGNFDSDFNTRNFIERGAYEDAQASAGTGTADPESWS